MSRRKERGGLQFEDLAERYPASYRNKKNLGEVKNDPNDPVKLVNYVCIQIASLTSINVSIGEEHNAFMGNLRTGLQDRNPTKNARMTGTFNE